MPKLDRKVAYLNPWGEHGSNLNIKINGHTGLLTTIGGGDYIPYDNIKDLKSFAILNEYDYLFIPFWGGFYEIINKIKATSTVKIVGVGDVELNAIPYAPRTELKKLVECSRLCDIFLTSNPDTIPLFSSIRSGLTVDITGWCIFPEIHRSFILDPLKKDSRHISIGCSNSGYNRNILENFLVFKKLLNDYPDLIGHYWCVHKDHEKDILDLMQAIGIPSHNVSLRFEYAYSNFLAEFSKMFISIHLYTFNVVSRLAQDAMALGIPHVGCAANYADRVYCPMSVEPYDIESAYESAKRLLSDKQVYSMTVMEQLDGVDTYSAETIGNKIIGAIEEYERTA